MASKRNLVLAHDKVKHGFFNGMAMPEIHEPIAEHLPKIKAMEIRDDDVILCSYPKSGTHWLYRVIDMVLRGQVMYDQRTPSTTFLDLQRIEQLAELDSPRLLVTHVPFDLLPQQVKDKRTKIVHVYRNPRAVLVSLHFQIISIGMHEAWKSDWSLDKMADKMFAGQLPYLGWFNYIDKVSDYEKNNPDQPIFHLSYEEMTKNPIETVKSLAEFVEKTGPPELYSGIVDACSFQKQKESEARVDPDQVKWQFYRKGDMNDWKNHITVAIDEKFGQVLKERTSCPFSTKY